jgi:hypothetical protein
MSASKKKPKVSAKSLANLKPVKPGEVRNPLGINRGRTYSGFYEEVAKKPLPEKIRLKLNRKLGKNFLQKGTNWAEANAFARHLGAIEDSGYLDSKEVREATEGKAPQRVELTGAGGKDLIPDRSLDQLTDEELKAKKAMLEAVLGKKSK